MSWETDSHFAPVKYTNVCRKLRRVCLTYNSKRWLKTDWLQRQSILNFLPVQNIKSQNLVSRLSRLLTRCLNGARNTSIFSSGNMEANMVSDRVMYECRPQGEELFINSCSGSQRVPSETWRVVRQTKQRNRHHIRNKVGEVWCSIAFILPKILAAKRRRLVLCVLVL